MKSIIKKVKMWERLKLSLKESTEVFNAKKFSFPERAPIQKSGITEKKLQRSELNIVFLSTILVVSMLLNVLFVWIVLYKADVVPYVSDGSTFGCLVPQNRTGEIR